MNPKHKKILKYIGLTVLVLMIAFVAKNLYDESQVEKVEQDASIIDRAVEIAEQEEESEGLAGEEEVFKGSVGTFVDGDAPYQGGGTAIVKTIEGQPVLVFESDFSVTPGPDLKVYLSKNNVASGEELGEFVSLGSLRANSGTQAYTLPDDYQDFNSVVIWCRAFSANFSSADLN